MNTVAKILIVVNLILAAAFLMSASNFLGQQDLWKAKHEVDTADLQEQLELKQAQLDIKIKDNADLLAQSQAMSKQLGEFKQQATDMKALADLTKEAYNQACVSWRLAWL